MQDARCVTDAPTQSSRIVIPKPASKIKRIVQIQYKVQQLLKAQIQQTTQRYQSRHITNYSNQKSSRASEMKPAAFNLLITLFKSVTIRD